MITGVVNADFHAVIRLRVRGTGGQELDIEAAIDTGYDNGLSLRPDQIAVLQLPYLTTDTATLADGNDVKMDIYQAVVVWDGQDIIVSVSEADIMPCVGMALLEGYDVCIHTVVGGPVTITKVP